MPPRSGPSCALCVPGGAGEGDVALGVMAGVSEAAVASGCPIVGGDVSESGNLMVSVTVLGTVESIGPPAVPRSGGQPDDIVLVTGPCGGSAAGLRALRGQTGSGTEYRRPVARLREGVLARRSGVRAMIDVSDGLALDLHRLADASGVGFRIDSVPVAEGATLEEALGGGEDYELVLVGDDEVSDHLCDEFVAAGAPPALQAGFTGRRSGGAAARRRGAGPPGVAAPGGIAAGAGVSRSAWPRASGAAAWSPCRP